MLSRAERRPTGTRAIRDQAPRATGARGSAKLHQTVRADQQDLAWTSGGHEQRQPDRRLVRQSTSPARVTRPRQQAANCVHSRAIGRKPHDGLSLFLELVTKLARGARCEARLDWSSVPLMAGVRDLAREGFVTGASGRNWAGYGGDVNHLPSAVASANVERGTANMRLGMTLEVATAKD